MTGKAANGPMIALRGGGCRGAGRIALALVCWGCLWTASRSRADEPSPADPEFAARLLDGTTVRGRIKQLTPEGALELIEPKSDAKAEAKADAKAAGARGGASRTFELRKVFKLTRVEMPPTTPAEGPIVLFPDGDRLNHTLLEATGETSLEARSDSSIGNIKIPIDALFALILTAPAEAEALDDLVSGLRAEPPRGGESALLANGDRVRGGFLALTDKEVKMQADAGALSLERAGVVAVAFDPKLTRYPRPSGVWLELTMVDGSRLGVREARFDEGQIAATTRFGVAIRVPLVELTRIQVRSPEVEFLSERKPDFETYAAYVGPTRGYRRDATVDGKALRLNGQEFDHGLGTQSRTYLAYRLKPGDVRLQATVGVDDRAGPLGNVVFRVLVDGKPRFVSPPMSSRETPLAVDLDLRGARNIILTTEFGQRGDVRDLGDWADARLVREPSAGSGR